jgi:hypothetical protein
MWARQVPVEILRLDVKREQVSQNDRQGSRYFRDGVGLKRRQRLSCSNPAIL